MKTGAALRQALKGLGLSPKVSNQCVRVLAQAEGECIDTDTVALAISLAMATSRDPKLAVKGLALAAALRETDIADLPDGFRDDPAQLELPLPAIQAAVAPPVPEVILVVDPIAPWEDSAQTH